MRKIGVLVLALVLAMGSLGVGYALWSEVLTITGTVQTGDIDAVWSVNDFGDDETKDISSCVASGEGTKTLTVDIIGAYPCVTYYVDWDIHSLGSVPIHFLDPVIDRGNLPAGTTFTFTDMVGAPIVWSEVQLHQSEMLLGKLTVHLDNDAEELTPYSFSITLTYHQYNESP